MRYIELFEDTFDFNEVLNACRKKFGSKLYGGNCGMFALAFANFLQENGIKSELFIICNFDQDKNVEPNDIMAAESDIYHVAVEINGKLYDGDGQVTTDHIINWIDEEYGEPSLLNSYKFPLGTKWLTSLIDNDTNWNIPEATFYNFMVSYQKKKNKKKMVEK